MFQVLFAICYTLHLDTGYIVEHRHTRIVNCHWFGLGNDTCNSLGLEHSTVQTDSQLIRISHTGIQSLFWFIVTRHIGEDVYQRVMNLQKRLQSLSHVMVI